MSNFEFIKVIKGIAKLDKDVTENEMHASVAAHLGIRNYGLLASVIECDRQGNPEYLISYWRLNERDTGENLPKGMRLVLMPSSTFDSLVKS
ncbi:hypothetical protein J4N45_10080 [Vibrio sp. SCSIO 43140]|uniref:hypothetical protein n=1 Tax=Vibrio sp. SCSIO 43140 TaxID=2819100 RepID=UPI002075339F|nr:hypothetical protein [Vibrio sp. SCSIO 43140]USD58877.1 hypothetical protein J4N45_10080 [Vibrio sp. SCSIO 43140]